MQNKKNNVHNTLSDADIITHRRKVNRGRRWFLGIMAFSGHKQPIPIGARGPTRQDAVGGMGGFTPVKPMRTMAILPTPEGMGGVCLIVKRWQ